MARVLIARRLSHGTDASTSIERQGDAGQSWADLHGHEVAAMTEDIDVSGAVSPFERPDLGRYLKPPLLHTWDVLAAWKIDRISRSVRDFSDLLDWCEANGKVFVSISEGMDFGTEIGKLLGKLVAVMAEFERAQHRARRADSSVKIASRAGWHGGTSASWGYKPVKLDGTWQLEPDPGMVPTIGEIVQAILGGESGQSVAQRHGMDPTRLLRRLRNPSLYGAVVFHGELVRGDDGMPVLRKPVIDRRTWDRLQAQLNRNSVKATPRDGTPWLGVIHCMECGHEMYRQSYSDRPIVRFYHRRTLRKYKTGEAEWCPMNVNGRSVESQIDGLVRRAWRGRYVTETIETPGEDHREELRGVEEAVADWEQKALLPGASSESILRILDGLNARKKAILDAGVVTEARVDEVQTETPLLQLWDACETDHERGALLRAQGYRLYVAKAGYAKSRVRIERTWRARTWRELIPEMHDDTIEDAS